jgi:hypothetical protein
MGYDHEEILMSFGIDVQFALFVIGLIVLGLAAATWGADTRPSFRDDHRA